MTLKTYVVNYDGRTHRLVAARSQAHAAILMGVTPYRMRHYGSQTIAEAEIELATNNVGTVFERGCKIGATWSPRP